MSYTTIATEFIERDYRVLRGLFESRVMTIKHVAALYFSGSEQAARKRIWKLKNAHLVGERTRDRPQDRSILHLTRRGFEMLTQEGRLIDYPSIGWPTMEKRTNVSPLTLQHELDVMTAKAAMLTASTYMPAYKIVEFSTWPRLFAFQSKTISSQGYGKRAWIKPDAFIRIRETDEHGFDATEHVFYLELDRSTEVQSRLQAKAGAYADHYRSGGLAKRFGAPPEAYEQFPFRILIVGRTAERCNNIAAAMLNRKPPILTMTWLTTIDDLCRDAFGAIWIRPLDYRDATKGTAFDPYLPPDGDGYKRQRAREEHVDAVIRRQALLPPVA